MKFNPSAARPTYGPGRTILAAMKPTAKNTILSAAGLCLTLTLLNSQTALAQNSVGVDLFNGKDFSGWTFFMRSNSAPEKTWAITNGLIHCTGKPNGFMRTEKSFQDYTLTVEWRFLKPGNTGVLVDMQLPDQVWSRCIECQGMHDHQGDMYFWSGSKCAELTKGPKVPRKAADAEKPVGEWNTFQVI